MRFLHVHLKKLCGLQLQSVESWKGSQWRLGVTAVHWQHYMGPTPGPDIVATQNSGTKALPSLLAVSLNIKALPRLQISLAQMRDSYIFLV